MDWKPIVKKAFLNGAKPDECFQQVRKEYEVKRQEVREYCDTLEKPKPNRTIETNKDGTCKSNGVIVTDKEVHSETSLLIKHGLIPPEKWQIEHTKSSIYEQQQKGGEIITLYATNIVAKPVTGYTEKDVLENFIEKAAKYSPVKPRIIQQSKENILLINISDLHLGQLSWGEESGENYDYKIATRKFKTVIEDVITKSPYKQYEKIYFVMGNDFFNSDNMEDKTTKGTQQTNDVRPEKMFNKGCELLIWALEALRTAFSTTPIETLLVRGNHEKITMYHAAIVANAWFRNDPTIEIDISPKQHKGIAYGRTALLFTHGEHEMKNLDWVYKEFRELIGKTKETEVHAGHLHRLFVEEKNGIVARRNSALTELNTYSYDEGYGSVSRAVTRVYSKQNGLEYEIYSRA